MKHHKAIRLATLAAAAASLLVAPLLAGGAAEAVGSPATAEVPCLAPATSGHGINRAADHGSVSAREAASVHRQLESVRDTLDSRYSSARIAARVAIPVYAHVIHGKHAGERDFSRADVKAAMRTLRADFAGAENGYRYTTRYVFQLYAVDFTTSEKQFHAAPMSTMDKYSKRRHHRGNRWALNLYFNQPDGGGATVLGYSRFPWEYRKDPRLDGVTIDQRSIEGNGPVMTSTGPTYEYSHSDTVTHEVGHWMGLLHTFQGGCRNLDGVADTPAEAYPGYSCYTTRDSCRGKPGHDPLRNYMDYTFDRCLNHFSHGQTRRMDSAWLKWRARSTA